MQLMACHMYTRVRVRMYHRICTSSLPSCLVTGRLRLVATPGPIVPREAEINARMRDIPLVTLTIHARNDMMLLQNSQRSRSLPKMHKGNIFSIYVCKSFFSFMQAICKTKKETT